jgi:hypothetical protein
VIDTEALTVTTTIPSVGSSYGYGKWIGENFILTVGLSGGGDGTIVGPGLSCVGNTCRGAYAYNSTFDITATAAATSVFSGWIGCSSPKWFCVYYNDNRRHLNDRHIRPSEPPPELSTDRGTIGTKLTVTGSGFGAKKGKVLIGGVATKIAKGAWTPTSITGEIKKTLPPGISYDVKLQLKEPKGVAPIIIPGAFTMMAPEIGTVLPNTGAEGASITISGNYFGSKKEKVYLGDKKCKVLTWEMNATTGGSTVSFVVPKKMAPGSYNVKVTNKVDSDTLANGFTIP